MTGVILLLAWGCSTARRSEPIAGKLPLEDVQLVAGRKVFHTHCHQCHPGGESGLGPALNNKPLPDFLVRFQVRAGMGAMPSFSEEEITDKEMENLLSYLNALRQHEPD